MLVQEPVPVKVSVTTTVVGVPEPLFAPVQAKSNAPPVGEIEAVVLEAAAVAAPPDVRFVGVPRAILV